jgi:bifunctional UDP-N-acetylglucosamine pyrophosphorylase/glucosamine-1-phosphate N-acetyltransferase
MDAAPMPPRGRLAIVLAAGEGTRMRSDRPKVLHALAGRSMLAHVLAGLTASGVDRIAVVTGPDQAAVVAEARRAAPEALFFVQAERLGTAHAVLAARAALEAGCDQLLVAFADTPLVRPETFAGLCAALAETQAAVAVLGFEAADPTGYGRLLTDGAALVAIREEKDASSSERSVRRCNAGLMALDGRHALGLLDAVGNANAQKEYYLTDVVAAAHARSLGSTVVMAAEDEVRGINDRAQLAAAEAILQRRLRAAAMHEGVTFLDPDRVTLAFDTVLGRDVLVEPNVFFGPGVSVGAGTTIRAFSHLEGATVGEKATVGPFARLRPGASLAADVHIGNFVEVKAAAIGAGAKINHLSYIGDATVGARTNIGAGVITCNYNGFDKFPTTIGEGAFVGVNAALVAPVTIGDGAYIGTGSVVTKDVAPDALAVARSRQVEKPGWATAFRAKNRAKDRK